MRQYLMFTALLCIHLITGSPHVLVKQLSLQEGLSNSFVQCIHDDHRGFIWIGTKIGLNRFDKKNIKHYFNNTLDSTSIPGNSIYFITEDSANNLWVSTDRGLVKYNRNKDNFTRINFNDNPLEVFSSFVRTNDILMGGSHIFSYNYSSKKITRLQLIDYQKQPTSVGYITGIVPWDKSTLLLSTRWNGLWLYNLDTGVVSPFPFLSEKYIQSIAIDSRNNYWISIYGKGVIAFDGKGNTLHTINSFNSKLPNNVVLDIREINRQLWMGTDGGGIAIFDPTKKTISILAHTPETPGSLPVNSIVSLFYDRNLNIWAGSVRGGLLGIKNVYMTTFQEVNTGSPNGLSNRTVLDLHEDEDQTIWIGTDGGGINHYNPHNSTFRHFRQTYNQKVVSIAKYSKSELLLSLYGRGVYIFHKQTGQLTPLWVVDKKHTDRINNLGLSINVFRFSENIFLFSADSSYLFNKSSQTFSKLKLKNHDSNQSFSALKLVINQKNQTILTGIHNLFELKTSDSELTPIFSIDRKHRINDAVAGQKGRIWMATTRGLEWFDPTTQQHDIITTWLFTEATSLFYFHEMVWIGARGLLFVYDINDKKFTVLGEEDGVLSNEFIPFSSLVSSDGYAYLGGVNGLLKIDKSISFSTNNEAEISLIEVVLDGVALPELRTGDILSIPWNNSSIVIKSIVKGQDILFNEKLYKFRISGLNQDIESYDHALTLYSLPEGTYEILASYNQRDGEWSHPINILTIRVNPPWWKTGWFFLLTIGLMIITITLIVRYFFRQKDRKLKQKMEAHKLVINEEKIRFLVNLSHELRTPLLLIYAPVKRMLDSGELSDILNKQLTGVYKQVKQIKNLINMVLDVQRLDAGEKLISPSSVALNDWLISIIEDFRYEFSSKNIQLKLHFDESINFAYFDKVKCEIICSNFLMNALKFSGENTLVSISTECKGEYIRISVADQGIGLNNEDNQQLFTRFYKGENSPGGTGIGLSYAKTLVELHKGKIGAFNNPEGGATFYFEIPTQELPQNRTQLPVFKAENSSHSKLTPNISSIKVNFNTSRYSLLLVEDDPELLTYLKNSYEPHFHKILTASNGAIALQLVNDWKPDVVVSDILIPEMDGFELLKSIKGSINTNYIPVILNTSQLEAEQATCSYLLGADAFLPKPFDLDSLYILICNVLKNREHIKSKYKNFGPVNIHNNDILSNATEHLLLKLNKTISENISNPDLNVQFIADNLNMSRSACYEKLQQLIGMGVSEYINKSRIDIALQLLINTSLPVADIAIRTGFNNQQYFAKVFKKITGETPTKFRENNKKQHEIEL